MRARGGACDSDQSWSEGLIRHVMLKVGVLALPGLVRPRSAASIIACLASTVGWLDVMDYQVLSAAVDQLRT